jgi:Major tropism determinant N-terminal domain
MSREYAKILLRRGTAAEWANVNPILEDGEPGLEIDTGKIKVGYLNKPWLDLEYWSGPAGPAGQDGTTIYVGTTPPANPAVNQLWIDIS